MLNSFKEYARHGMNHQPKAPSQHGGSHDDAELLEKLESLLHEEGSDEEYEKPSSGPFLGIRKANPGEEIMLSPIKSLKRFANPDAKVALGDEHEAPKEPSWLGSVSRLLIFNELTRPGKRFSISGGKPHYVPTPSKADRVQQGILKTIQTSLGDPVPLMIPDDINIRKITADIHDQLNHIPLHKKDIIADPKHFETDVERRARKLTEAIYNEQPDETKPRPEEHAVAEELWHMRSMTTPGQRRSLLRERVYERAQDVTTKQRIGSLLYKIRNITNIYNAVTGRPPKAWLVNDYLTSEILLTPDEQRDLESILWGINAKDLWIRDIKGKRDVLTIPLSKFVAKNGDGLLLTVDQPEFFDRVVRPLGRLRPIADRFFSPSSVGRLKIETLGRDNILAQFTVRDAGETKKHIMDVAKRAGEIGDTIKTISTHVKEPDPDSRFIIRPSKVFSLLPDPTIMHFDPVERRSRPENIQMVIQEILGLRRQALGLQRNLEKEGTWNNANPARNADRRAVNFLSERYRAAEQRYLRLTDRAFEDDLRAGKIKP